MDSPVKKTRAEIEEALVRVMREILGSCVTNKALRYPSELTIDDLLVNIHLYERLGEAFVAVRALNGYTGDPRGFELIESIPKPNGWGGVDGARP